MRLNQYLAQAGIASRRGAEVLIKKGLVKVNGQFVTELATQVDPNDQVEFNGKLISSQSGQKVIYLLNKPRGVVTTAVDPAGRKTVLDLIPQSPRVYPCGRLDAETEGLVVLTNDGDLCYRLTHPKFEHQKVYLIEGSCRNPQQAAKQMLRGVKLSDGPAKVDQLKILKASGNKVRFEVTIHEGRNRIIRRLAAQVGIEISSLVRTRIGEYELGDIETGQYHKI